MYRKNAFVLSGIGLLCLSLLAIIFTTGLDQTTLQFALSGALLGLLTITVSAVSLLGRR
jgi:uncharacterized membrane protein